GGCKANHARRSLESSWVLEHWRDVRQDHGSVKTEREMMRCVFFAVIMVVVCATVAAADSHEALMWYRKAAEQGDAWAQYNLGLMYYFGQSIPQDYQEALKWYRQVAERGFARAQYNLG